MLNEKWFQFGAQLYVWNLLLYILQVFFLTIFSLSLPHPLTPSCEIFIHQTSYVVYTERVQWVLHVFISALTFFVAGINHILWKQGRVFIIWNMYVLDCDVGYKYAPHCL